MYVCNARKHVTTVACEDRKHEYNANTYSLSDRLTLRGIEGIYRKWKYLFVYKRIETVTRNT